MMCPDYCGVTESQQQILLLLYYDCVVNLDEFTRILAFHSGRLRMIWSQAASLLP